MIVTIANQQYRTSKEEVKNIFKDSGFEIKFVPESISGKFRKDYYSLQVKHNFKCFADKLKAGMVIKKELDKLEKI